jgi:hypothetical protein
VWEINGLSMASLLVQLDDAEMLKCSQKLLELSRAAGSGDPRRTEPNGGV